MTTSQITIEPIHVVDTNALIWYLTADKKLGRQAAAIFAGAERGDTQLFLSAVVLAELYYANQKWHWFDDFRKVYAEVKSKPYFRFVPLFPDDVLEFDDNASIPEMHDRIIVALARRLQAPLLTADSVITAADAVTVIW